MQEGSPNIHELSKTTRMLVGNEPWLRRSPSHEGLAIPSQNETATLAPNEVVEAPHVLGIQTSWRQSSFSGIATADADVNIRRKRNRKSILWTVKNVE